VRPLGSGLALGFASSSRTRFRPPTTVVPACVCAGSKEFFSSSSSSSELLSESEELCAAAFAFAVFVRTSRAGGLPAFAVGPLPREAGAAFLSERSSSLSSSLSEAELLSSPSLLEGENPDGGPAARERESIELRCVNKER
jgi:hypothetical protein